MRLYPVWDILHEGGYDSVYDALLQSRNLTSDDLAVGADGLHSPRLLADLERAVGRMAHSIRAGEKIVVFGDYDADGITSTALMLDFLDRVGASYDHLLPDRHKDGYGMKPEGVSRALQMGAELLVTVDNGISAHEGIEHARRCGLDVVVIDHHKQVEELPPAHSVVNPNRKDSTYPFKGLAAVGVTFKVVQVLSDEFIQGQERRAYLNSLLDLVALGSVADVAPVLDENRVLIRHGMKVLERSERPGLRQLKEVARCAEGRISTTAIGFYLGPRLNSAGRLASPELALSLLRTDDEEEARQLAAELDALNGRRRDLQRAAVREARALVSPEDLETDRILIVLGEAWNPGIIGLIASDLAETFQRPAVVATDARRDGIYVGSARSIEAYDITEGISSGASYLTTYGGHKLAAGFSMPGDKFEAFRSALIDHANDRLTADDLRATLKIDMMLNLRDLNESTVDDLSRMEPFGSGNEVPLFAANDLQIEATRRVGAGGEHLKVVFKVDGRSCSGVWWRQGPRARDLSQGDRVAAAFELEEDSYSGFRGIQMVIRDMYPTSADAAPPDQATSRMDELAEIAEASVEHAAS